MNTQLTKFGTSNQHAIFNWTHPILDIAIHWLEWDHLIHPIDLRGEVKVLGNHFNSLTAKSRADYIFLTQNANWSSRWISMNCSLSLGHESKWIITTAQDVVSWNLRPWCENLSYLERAFNLDNLDLLHVVLAYLTCIGWLGRIDVDLTIGWLKLNLIWILVLGTVQDCHVTRTSPW